MRKNEKPSEKIIGFLRTLKLTSARFYGQPFEPLPWFKDIIRGIYDPLLPNGKRKIKEAYIEIPRKNAKSHSMAGLALYHAFCSGEMDGQIYIVASDRSNAQVIFDMLASMIGQSKILRERCIIRNSIKEIYVPETETRIKAMSADIENKHGLSPSLVLYDELHTARNRELYDVMVTGMGAREEPLIIAITTAGYDINSFCYQQHLYCKDWMKGLIKDETFFGYIRGLELDEDWEDPKNWEKANPSWGITVDPEEFKKSFIKAKNQKSAQENFRRFRLCQWRKTAEQWLDNADWINNEIDIDTKGYSCWCGLDLSSTDDLTCFVQVFKIDDNYIIKPHFFLPTDTIDNHQNSKWYQAWLRNKDIIPIYGNVVDHNFVAEYIINSTKENPIEALAYDPYMSTQILVSLQNENIKTVQYAQGFRSISPATKDFEVALKKGKIKHLKNPVLDWCAGNAQLQTDIQGNVKPVKVSRSSAQKIDGIVASIMACDLAGRMEPNINIYDERGGLFVV